MPQHDSAALDLAERVGRAMLDKDDSARFLGVRLDSIGPGRATLSMTVTAPMLNAFRRCHGGFIFKLADDAFAYACNSYDRSAVGVSCTINYPAAAHLGDCLTATAEERHRRGRSGTYDVTVTNQDGEVVALFRGECRIIDGAIVE